MPDHGFLEELASIVEPAYCIASPDESSPYLTDFRRLFTGSAVAVVKPASTQQVADTVRACNRYGYAVVPFGGNTGLCGGAAPSANGNEVIISLERINKVRAVDLTNNMITLDAGCILQNVQEEAVKLERYFPLSLAAEGTCQIGGNIATNAGGTAVLRYGNTRELVLGLEVVLPTGEIWDGLRRLKKDNTGYDLRDLFIGAEGTLGVITGAVLKLVPRPVGHEVAFAGLRSVTDALALFDRASRLCGAALTGSELMPRIGIEFTARHIPGVRDPLPTPHAWYALIDVSTSDSADTARRMVEALMTEAMEHGLAQDAVIATSEAQRQALWHMRESMSPAQKPEGGSIKHDVSVPVSSIPAFMAEADKAVSAMIPGVRICAFGHMGDGNIHYNLSQPVGADKQAFLDRWHEVNAVVHGIVLNFGGSISAEHGIGQLKRDELAGIRAPIEIDLMRRIKHAFDPAGIMNPGKVLRTG